MEKTKPFWEEKTLKEMTAKEWESLCDGCGRCCLHKVQDDETEEVFYTQVSCKLLDPEKCHCTDYQNRLKRVPGCINLKDATEETYEWLPSTCAYKKIFRGESLENWHPLISGDPLSIHKAKISVAEFAISEERFDVDDYQDFVIGLD